MHSLTQLSYQSLKCVAVNLDYNVRIQLTKRCPLFSTVHKQTPAKIDKLLVATNEIKIEDASYRLEEQHGSVCFLNTMNQKVESLGHAVKVDQATDYLIQILFGRRPGSTLLATLAPNQLLVNSLSLSGYEYRYPFINSARKLTIVDNVHIAGLHHITRPKICFRVIPGRQVRCVRDLVRFAEQELTHRANYTIELESSHEYRYTMQCLALTFEPLKKIILCDGTVEFCLNCKCFKANNMEVNVYMHEKKDVQHGARKYSVQILVCPRGSAVLKKERYN